MMNRAGRLNACLIRCRSWCGNGRSTLVVLNNCSWCVGLWCRALVVKVVGESPVSASLDKPREVLDLGVLSRPKYVEAPGRPGWRSAPSARGVNRVLGWRRGCLVWCGLMGCLRCGRLCFKLVFWWRRMLWRVLKECTGLWLVMGSVS